MIAAALLTLLSAAPEVSLDEALALALVHNAELKVTRAEVAVAQASVPLAHDWEMPRLRVQFNDVQNVPTGQFTWYAGLAWRPPNPWEWKNGGEAAEAKLVQARFELAASSWRVVKEVRLAWLDVSGAAAHEQVAKEAVGNRARLLSVLRRRLEQGGGTQVELNLAQLSEIDARQDLLRWQNAGLKAAQSVAWLVGQSVKPLPTTLADAPPALPALPALERRLEGQPRLEALRVRVQVTEALQRNLAARRLPWPEVQFRFREQTGAPANNDYQVGLTVPLGVTPAPQLEVAHAVTVRAQAQLEAEKAQLAAELQILFSRAEGLRERWLGFQQDYRATLESHRALQSRVLAEGTLDPTLLMTADRQAIELEHKRLEVQLDLARALVELDAVAGPP